MFEIQNLHVNISEVDKKIIDGINLKINPGEIHAIMGPNGSGKSTLSYTLSGKDGYEVINGDIKLDDESILELEADERVSPMDKIPVLSPTPQVSSVESQHNRIKKNVFLTLNDAAKVRDSRTKLSLIAQEYINLAYEMGGDSWYGAEEVWGTDAFKNRVNELHEDDG